MREILFRGKRLDNGEWAEGSLMSVCGRNGKDDYASIRVFTYHKDGDKEWVDWEDYEVDPATVGQYTGLKDKNGEKIFEGDIISDGRRFHVKWDLRDACWDGEMHNDPKQRLDLAFLITHKQTHIIGNIHDNADLIE